ncbi:MAG: hypothetical protein K9N46_06575 [Candidatus Marinimicrobia bacterium]|nr:hypothetical protein [Candidatus Neomarinimicrobiota bacterium]MCF7828644.1 hypothetical protein [Candidatus Neomarinimicrobiota bacterium]MCF7880385.1 hypothetical protein [Candidatus Neomarinimicrobiota bacterium]
MKFNHAETGFPLRRSHATVSCRDCHTGNSTDTFHEFTVPGILCEDCHQDVHQTNLGTDCSRCHSPSAWTEIDSREIHDGTLFPLTGVHLAVYCGSCHSSVRGQTYSGTPVRCEECHIEDYTQTTQPSHETFGFQSTCQDCHNTLGWRPANPDHARFGLLLRGNHGRMACLDCHLIYEFADQNCYQCHQADYNRGHTQQNYIVSQDCWLCHTTGTWRFGNHDELYFPIYSGEHRGTWDNCEVCHVQLGDFGAFSCGLNGICHAHRQSEMDSEHRGEASGYRYESTACYNCHPDGREDD